MRRGRCFSSVVSSTVAAHLPVIRDFCIVSTIFPLEDNFFMTMVCVTFLLLQEVHHCLQGFLGPILRSWHCLQTLSFACIVPPHWSFHDDGIHDDDISYDIGGILPPVEDGFLWSLDDMPYIATDDMRAKICDALDESIIDSKDSNIVMRLWEFVHEKKMARIIRHLGENFQTWKQSRGVSPVVY
ncbi:unnamed protein product [Somion occarium]|uniref:Uncharacterized protein n=1 Tax=Somion occarium TaxID=3059160 RepID=A0ABP1CJW8_9APHY